MFSQKATKIDKIFTVELTLCSKRQIDGEDFVNFLRKYELLSTCIIITGASLVFETLDADLLSTGARVMVRGWGVT